jgi:hypothetical protein
MLNFCGGERHCASNVLDLEPTTLKALGSLAFRDNTDSSLGHDVGNELVSIK